MELCVSDIEVARAAIEAVNYNSFERAAIEACINAAEAALEAGENHD